MVSQNPHDPGGALGGVPYFHPVHRPGAEHWQPLDKGSRLKNRMMIAAEDVIALVNITNGRENSSELTALMKSVVVCLDNLHTLIVAFHAWVRSGGGSDLDDTLLAEEGQAFSKLNKLAIANTLLKPIRNKIAAHMDADDEEIDLVRFYEELRALRTTLNPVLQATSDYLGVTHRMHVGRFIRQEGDRVHVAMPMGRIAEVPREQPEPPGEK